MHKNTLPSNFEDKVQAVTRMPAPDPEFVEALWSKLEMQTAKVGRRQRMQSAFRTTWHWGLSLAALVLLVGLLVLSINWLPKNSRIPGAVQETPTGSQHISLVDAERLIHAWYQNNRPDLNPQVTIPLQELTTDEIWNRMGVQVFQVSGDIYQYDTFLIRNDQVQQMGTAFGGVGVNSMAVTDLNQDGKPELLFTYSFGSGIHRSHLALYSPDLPISNGIIISNQALFNGDLRLVKTNDQQVTVEGAVFNQDFIPMGQVLFQARDDLRSVMITIQLNQGLPSDILDNLRSQPDPVQTVQPVPTSTSPLPATIPDRLVEGACNLPISQAFGGQYTGRANQDNLTQLVGGGSAQSGDFTFEIWLACGAAFGKQAYLTPHFSEIEGLGLLFGYRYQGPDLEGEVADYLGFEPYIREHGTESALSTNTSTFSVSGIQFPTGIIPDFSQADVPLRYMLKVRTPDGNLSGAVLSFVLQRQAEGFQPVDIQVSPLSEADLQYAESPTDSAPPFPTLDPEAQYPELKEVRELLGHYQDPLLSTPGWIYSRIKNEHPGGNGPYGTLTEWTGEEWLQIDEKGYVTTFVHVDRGTDGQIIQQVYSTNGETHNLTYGTSSHYTPYRLDLGSGLYTELLRWLQGGKSLQRTETSLDEKAAWMYAFSDVFSEPREIESILTSALTSHYAVDQESGKLLYQEMVRTVPQGQDQLVWRMTYDIMERIPQPPEEVIQLLGQELSPYQPPAPQGTPAPTGFDPAQSELTLQSLPGDDFNRPSFWYGDIYAGDYFLGRVNFGGSPGGFCDRSADGSKLAFSFLVPNNASESHEYLRWLDLRNVTQVIDPVPDLELVSKVVWSPQGNQIAFTACKADHSACGLYILDADTNQIRMLPAAGGGYVPPVWKPDASQIAFLGPDANDGLVLYVLDVTSGETVYTGPFNPDTWQAAEDAPTNDWGVEIRREYAGSDCFINP